MTVSHPLYLHVMSPDRSQPDRKVKIIASVLWALFLGVLELPLRLWRDVLAPLWSDPLQPVWGLDSPAPYKSRRQHDADIKEVVEQLKKARGSGQEVSKIILLVHRF